MNPLLLATRLLLAAVLGLAGVAKLLDPAGSRRSMREFGLPPGLAQAFAWTVPVVELVCAAALIPAATAWWGALGAVLLLAAFTGGIVVNLIGGRTPECHCFGKLHSAPVGWTTVARNGGLAALALLVVSQGRAGAGPGLVGWVGGLTSLELAILGIALGLVALAGGVVLALYNVIAQNGRLLLRIEALEARLVGHADTAAAAPGLAAGMPAPAFVLPDLEGAPFSLETAASAGGSVLLLFIEPGCGACDDLLPDVAEWQRRHAGRLAVVPISRGDLDVNLGKARRHGLERLLLQADREVAEAYHVVGTPSAVVVEDGRIASPLAAGAPAIRELVFGATLPPPVHKGDVVPALPLHDLEGEPFDLAAYRGRRVVLLFWGPACGFCQAMLDEVRSWERTRPRRGPELVVFSAGSEEANREQRFRARVVLDQTFGAGRVFGVSGTPSAVEIDEEGRVASEVGAGAPSVLELLGVRQQEHVTA